MTEQQNIDDLHNEIKRVKLLNVALIDKCAELIEKCAELQATLTELRLTYYEVVEQRNTLIAELHRTVVDRDRLVAINRELRERNEGR